MFFRLLGLVLLVLATVPVLNFSFGLVNDPSNLEVVVGLAILTTSVVAWRYIVKYYLKYFKNHFSEAGKQKINGVAIIMMALASIFFNSACATRVGPGYVGIKVSNAGDNRGVNDLPLSTGWVGYTPFFSQVFEYPTFVQIGVWTASPNEGKPVNEEITFTTGDQMQVAADISLAYHLVAQKVPAFYVKFRSDDLKTFTHGFLRNLAREKFDNVAGRYKIETIMGDNAPFLAETRAALQKDLDTIGVQLDQFGFIGAPRPPKQVVDAINGKVQATQDAIRVENEVRQAKAEAEKRVAQAEGEARAAIAKATGDAKANQVLTSSITSTLLEWRRLEIQQASIAKWDGKLPTYNGSGALPMIQLPQK